MRCPTCSFNNGIGNIVYDQSNCFHRIIVGWNWKINIARICITIYNTKGWDTKILATDLDTNVVATGREAIYGLDRVDGLEKSVIAKNFENLQVDGRSKVKVKKELRDLCYFKQLNLLREWPMRGPFDFIFCRNVVIYFDKPTQKVLFDRFAELLAPGGYLLIGHSESMYKLTDRFESLGNTIYRKIK